MDKILKGRSGEEIAANYLKRIGYEIIVRNYKTETGEIDIIAAGEGYIVFVEVKLRLNDGFGRPSEAVGWAKMKKISQVASEYINSFGLYDAAVRFDVIEVFSEDKSVNHIPDAFDSFLRY